MKLHQEQLQVHVGSRGLHEITTALSDPMERLDSLAIVG